MSVIEELGEGPGENAGEAGAGQCAIVPVQEREDEVSMEEIIFWAGLATGMEAGRQLNVEGYLSQAGEKLFAYALVFAYSLREAMVELTLQELER